MKIAIMTDAHANLPALQAALGAIRAEGCDALFHTGDAIAIGPYPAECLDLLLGAPNMQFVMGNHDSYWVNGLPEPRPPWMSEGEAQHQHWTHAQLDPQLKPAVAQWPYFIEREFESVPVTFVHYGLALSHRDFAPVVRQPTAPSLDQVFAAHQSELIFYGHHHGASDLQGRARYITPGSLGCHTLAIARYCIAQFHQGQYTIEQRSVPYDDTGLWKAFEQRDVPERAFIYKVFFGGRFQSN